MFPASCHAHCQRLDTQALQDPHKTMLRLFHDPALSPGNSGHRQETQIRPGLTQSPGYPLNLRRLEHQSILSLNKQKNSQEQK
jgi:hypothetical protein